MAFANAGFPVTCWKLTEEALQRGLATIEKNYAISVARGSLTRRCQAPSGMACSRAPPTMPTSPTATSSSRRCSRTWRSRRRYSAGSTRSPSRARSWRPTPPISTSTRSPRRLARPQDVVGLHFFSPANVMKLLEIVRGREDRARRAGDRRSLWRERIGKVPVVVGVCHGFVGNRMLAARGAESESAAAGGRDAQPDRQGVHRFRLADGAVPDGRPRRPRHRLAQPQGARA